MTTDTPVPSAVSVAVIQSDIDLANLIALALKGRVAPILVSGNVDVIRTIARHRLALSPPPPVMDVERMREELSRLHEDAKGCTFDLVPADGPIARLALFMHEKGDKVIAALTPLAAEPARGDAVSFQAQGRPWLMACFGEMIAGDREERNHRFLEEALELVQSLGCTASEAHQLVDYVYGRPVGDPPQEVGGVMVTLAALCLAKDLDMHAAGWAELNRIWGKVEQIRAKQAAKPKHSPLPEAPKPNAGQAAEGVAS